MYRYVWSFDQIPTWVWARGASQSLPSECSSRSLSNTRGSWHGERYISRRNVRTQTKLAIVLYTYASVLSNIQPSWKYQTSATRWTMVSHLDALLSPESPCVCDLQWNGWNLVYRLLPLSDWPGSDRPGKQLSLVNYTGSSCFLLKTQSTSIQSENIKEYTGYLNLFWFPNVPAFKKCKFKQTSWFLVTFAFPSSWIIKPLGFEAHLQFEL